jgi:uncharacterized membrane protein
MINFLANSPDYEDMGVKTLLITAVISLSVVIRYLYKERGILDDKHAAALKEKDEKHLTAIKEKDAKIMEVVSDHQDDLKLTKSDMKEVITMYHKFTDEIKSLVNGK